MHDILFYLLIPTFICVAAPLIIAGGALAIVNIVSEVIRRYQDIRKTLNPIKMFTPDQKQQVRELYDYGFAVEEIAERLELDETDVLNYVDEIEQGDADDEPEPDFEL